MEGEYRQKLILNMISFYIIFEKEIFKLFYNNNNSELTPILFKALYEIYISNDITPSELSKRLVLSSSNNSRGLQKLTENGYVIKDKDNDDKRIIHLKLSKKGYKLIEMYLKVMDETVMNKFNVISLEDIEELSKNFSILRDIFEKVEALNANRVDRISKINI